MKINELKIGARVHWTDPDNDECSGDGVIVGVPADVDEESIIDVSLDSQNEVQVFPHELELIDGAEIDPAHSQSLLPEDNRRQPWEDDEQ